MSTLNLTPREEELLCAVVEVMKTEVRPHVLTNEHAFLTSSQIVWADVAPKANFTNAKQARDKWAAVRAKIIACRCKTNDAKEGGDEAKSADSATPKKATPRKRKAGE